MTNTNAVFAVALTMLLAFSNATYFSIMVSPSEEFLELGAFSANGNRIWIGKPTASKCPPNASRHNYTCPGEPSTNFAMSNSSSGSLVMGAAVPGGQQVYINPSCGSLAYTAPHSSSMPGGAVVKGWYLEGGSLEGPNLVFRPEKNGDSLTPIYACPTSKLFNGGPWVVKVGIGKNTSSLAQQCKSINLIAPPGVDDDPSEDVPAAWSYG